ncbi:Transcription initiation factor IIA subunit 2-like protein [Drosera capensis]
MVDSGMLSPHIAMQVLLQFHKGNLHTYRFIGNVWTFILQDTVFRNEEGLENNGGVALCMINSISKKGLDNNTGDAGPLFRMILLSVNLIPEPKPTRCN